LDKTGNIKSQAFRCTICIHRHITTIYTMVTENARQTI